MDRRTLLAAALGSIALAACTADRSAPDGSAGTSGQPASASGTVEEILAAHGLDGLEAREIVDRLDRLPVAERPTDLMASVRPHELVLSGPEGEGTLPLPEGEFYLSLAPFADQTHECFYHSLTTCRGELAGEDIAIRIVDDSGEVLAEEGATTFDNGFIGYWLPAGRAGTVEVTARGRSGSAAFDTTAEGATCMTTLQLS